MVVDLPKLYMHQQIVMQSLIRNWDGCFHIVKARRQCGKSILAEIILQYAALSKPGSRCYLISKSFSQADKILSEIKTAVIGKPFYNKCNNIKRCIYFKNKSEIRVFSAEQGEDILRGYTCELLIIDEAAYIPDNIIDCILPWVNVSNGPVLMFSTPNAKAGRFYEYYTSSQPKVFTYDWAMYDMSMFLSAERLEMYRKQVDPYKFKTDYLGEFLNNESQFFGDYSGCIYDRPYFQPPERTCLIGIDWAGSVGGDYTSIVVLSNEGHLIDLIYFNDKDPNQTLDAVLKVVMKYLPKKVTVETNSIGNIYYGLLKDKLKAINTPLVGFVTTNETKDKIISKLQVAIQNNKIKLFHDIELMKELQAYEMTFSKTGKRVFNAKDGFHDDLIMSLAIAYNSISSGQCCYSII